VNPGDEWRPEDGGQPPMMPIGQPPPAYLPPAGPKPNIAALRTWRIGCLSAVIVFFGFATLVSFAYGSPLGFVWAFLFVVFLGLALMVGAGTGRRSRR
jgi:hypothetical protein